jgi:sulfoxide reductase heme-binding subunit YedZ
MPRVPWHLSYVRALIGCSAAVAWIGIAVVSWIDSPDAAQAWISARQLYGLWALALLVASMLPGPLGFVLPWLPLKAHLVLGRRAAGISAFFMAVSHAACYLGPIAYSGAWRSLYAPGVLWIAGLLIGLPVLAGLAVLASTSRATAVRSLGPRRWKRLHRMVYFLLPAALLHAIFIGTDFGLNKGPDVAGEGDAGCLFGMVSLSLAWLILYALRRSRMRWTPSILQRAHPRWISGPAKT